MSAQISRLQKNNHMNHPQRSRRDSALTMANSSSTGLARRLRQQRYKKNHQEIIVHRKNSEPASSSPPKREVNQPDKTAEHRLQTLREIRSSDRFLARLEALPNEMIMVILSHHILQHFSDLRIETEEHCSAVAGSIMGGYAASENLQDLCKIAVIENCVHRLDIAFKGTPENRIAVLPSLDYQNQIKHLELCLDSAVAKLTGTVYPVQIFKATDAMDSLLSQLPNLKTLRILITTQNVKIDKLHSTECHRRGLRNGKTQLSKVVEDLILAVHRCRPTLLVFVQVQCLFEGSTWDLRCVEVTGMNAGSVIQECTHGVVLDQSTISRRSRAPIP